MIMIIFVFLILQSLKKGKSTSDDIIRNWLRNRITLEFLETWESIYNPNFNSVEFDEFRKNAEKMNIDIDSINKVVISHGHDDHTRGLKYFLNKKRNIELISHPESFNYKEDDTGLYIGSPLLKEELSKLCNLKLSKVPIKVTKNIIYLGEIPTLNDFEPRYTIGKSIINGEKIDDNIEEDSAIYTKELKVYL